MSLKLLFIAFLWLYIFVGVHVFSFANDNSLDFLSC